MKLEITSGINLKAIRCMFYGVEGVGKTTLASQFPDPVFIDTEGSTATMDVRRLPKPETLQDFLDEIEYVVENRPCKSLVIDTVDWMEKAIQEDMCREFNINGIEDVGYGKGYTYLTDRVTKVLNRLENVINAGIHVVLIAHSKVEKIEQPGEAGSYDHWGLKLQKRNSPLFKEWVDLLCFIDYEIVTRAVNKEGTKLKATGGRSRVMHFNHTAAYDAKNRFGFPDELPLSYDSIRPVIESGKLQAPKPITEAPKPITEAPKEPHPELALVMKKYGVDNETLEQYCWSNFNHEQVRNVPIGDWPEDFQFYLCNNWSYVYEELFPDRGVADINNNDLPF